MSKKVPYIGLLKEAIMEYDTSKTVDVKGPMLTSILSYGGETELKTHQGVSDILERYYFNQKADKGVTVEDVDNSNSEPIDQIGKDVAMDLGKPMPEAAPSEDSSVPDLKDKIEDALGGLTGTDETPADTEVDELQARVKEMDNTGEGEEEEKEETLDVDKKVSEIQRMENSVIAKLIAEMEELETSENLPELSGEVSGTEPAPGPMDDDSLIPDLEKVSDEVEDNADEQIATEPSDLEGEDESEEESDEDESGEEESDEDESGEEESDEDESGEEDEDEKKISEMLGPNNKVSPNVKELEEQFKIFKESIEEETFPRTKVKKISSKKLRI